MLLFLFYIRREGFKSFVAVQTLGEIWDDTVEWWLGRPKGTWLEQ